MREENRRKMVQAIREEYRKGKMPEEVYRILIERWGGEIEEPPEAEELVLAEAGEAEPVEIPPEAEAKDIESVVNVHLREIDNLNTEILGLEVELETTNGTLKGLKGRLSSGAITKPKYEKLAQQYTARIKELKGEISKKKARVAAATQKLNRLKAEIQKEIDAYTRILKRIEKRMKG